MGSDSTATEPPRDVYEGDADVFIPVMGVTGSGKSTFISLVADEHVPVSDGLRSSTAVCKMYRVRHPTKNNLFLLDTPGFDDTNRSDTEILKEIASSLVHCHRKGWMLAGMMYLHRITDPRIGGAASKSLRMFQELCGIENYQQVILVTNMWNELGPNEVDQQVGVRREDELRNQPQFWGPMVDKGSRCMRHNGSKESAVEIVESLCPLVGAIDLQIVEELLSRNLPLDETKAGKYIQTELLVAKERCKREYSSLMEILEEAKRDGDGEAIEGIQSEIHEAKVNLEQLDCRHKGLALSAQELSWNGVEYDGPRLAMSDSAKSSSSAKVIGGEKDSIQQLQEDIIQRTIEDEKLKLEGTRKQLRELQQMARLREETEQRENERREKENKQTGRYKQFLSKSCGMF